MPRERSVEWYLKCRVEKIGGACEKHVNPGHRGDPDRLLSFPWGYQCLVETKWADDAPVPDYQLRRHMWWKCRGMPVFVLKSKAEVDAFIINLGARL